MRLKTLKNADNLFERRDFLKLFGLAFVGMGALALPFGAEAAPENKMLIIYFSHSGNTRAVAKEIQSLTHADLVEIRPLTPFPENYDALVALAENQAAEHVRLKFTADMPANLQDYGVIFLGFPIWAYTMPMIVYSFLDQYKFAGKKIAPFSTHMGSGLADAPERIAHLCPQATVLPGLAVRGSNAANSLDAVKKWLIQLGLIK